MRRPSISALLALAVFVCTGLLAPPRAHAIGVLVPTRADVEPLMIKSHRVHVVVRERSAETRVDQVFRNHTSQVLEATYIFPVPAGASVSGFAMWVNGRRQQGELLEAGRAREIYEGIVARMRDPGLVEHMGGSLFRARVFPIQPNAEQRIEISFTQTLDYQDGVVHYSYPLRTSGPAARTLDDMTIDAQIVSRTPIRAVYSPTHTVSVARPDDHHATIGFEAHAVTLDTDFDLFYTVQDRDVGLSLLTHRVPGSDGYFLGMIAPRAEVMQREIASKEVLFVFDTSGSMSGDKIDRARAALDYMLARLNPSDRFQVVRFSTDVETLFDGGGAVPATPQNIASARSFTRGFAAAGGTAIHPALIEAFRQRRAAGLPRMVVFLTDGMPTIGETDPSRIVDDVSRSSGDARLFVFGVGDDVNTTFLDALAQRNRGAGDYFRDGAEMERRLSAFYDRIAYPLFTDLRLAFGGAGVYDVYPRDLGHLYRGGQLLVVGRYRGDGAARLTLTGRVSHEAAPRSFAYDVRFPPREDDNDFIPRLFATRKIGYLLDEIRMRGERPELRDEVVRLARQFGIVTPYTSFLVAEDEEMTQLPQGVAPMPTPTPTPVPREEPQVGQQPQARWRRPADVRPSRPTTAAAPPPAQAGAESAARDFAGFGRATSRSYEFADDQMSGNMSRPDGDTMHARRSGGSGDSASTSRSMMRQLAPRTMSGGSGGANSAPNLAPSGGMGESGRRLSNRLRSMREAEHVGDAPSLARYAGGHTFRSVSGVWIDAQYRRGMRELRLEYASRGYFALVRARPDLRAALALGARVVIAIDGNRAIVVDTARSPAGEAEVQRFLAEHAR